MYSCHHFGPSLEAATSSRYPTVVDETHMIVPAFAAARAVAISPSGCASFWYAHGATRIGIARSVPRRLVEDPAGRRR